MHLRKMRKSINLGLSSYDVCSPNRYYTLERLNLSEFNSKIPQKNFESDFHRNTKKFSQLMLRTFFDEGFIFELEGVKLN
jgi:hypothetical protein